MTNDSQLSQTVLNEKNAIGRPASPKVAVVGCGRWGRNLIRNFHNLNFLYAVCDLQQEQLREIHKQYPDIAATSDYTQLLANPEIHAIVIATPSHTHFKLAKMAMEAGKHVYV